MSPWWKRYLYGQAFAIPAFVVTIAVTDVGPIAFIASIVTFKLAIDDWDAQHPLAKP